MKIWNLKVILKSDFCTATGEGIPGITNIKTALEHGLPYIPAKRMKGCLLEAGKEMRDNGLVEQSMLAKLFGRAGAKREEGIYIGDAHLYSVPEFLFGKDAKGTVEIEDYGKLQREIRNCLETEKVYLEDFFTRRRTRTAIDVETGSACKHSLRTIQVVPAGVVFVSRIEGELDAEEEGVLRYCVKGLRHMGIGITRGLGEIQCILEEVLPEKLEIERTKDDAKEKTTLLKKYHPEEEVMLSYEITLDSPVVIEETESGDCLAAGQVLGALARMYIKQFSLGANAHEDKDFCRIFLRNGVRFGYGFLKKGEKTYTPCPKAMASMKDDENHWFYIGKDEKNRRRKEIHGLIHWEDTELQRISPHKEIRFHHARPADRGIGHALNDRAADRSTPTGEFFQYVALSKGQTYEGTWRGKKKDIESLVKCLQTHDNRLRLGKSRTAEYGNCTFRMVDVSAKREQAEPQKCGTKWMLWLLSPLICQDEESGEYTLEKDSFEKELENVLGCGIKELKKVACSYMVYSGYNSKWRLPSGSTPAFAAGSTFSLETTKEVSADQFEDCQWGAFIGRGCGQVEVELMDEVKEGKIIADQDEGADTDQERVGLLARILDSQKKQLESKEMIKVWRSLEHEVKLPPSSSIAQLIQLLKSQDECQGIYKQIEIRVGEIQNSKKKERILEFLKPCKGESYTFMKLYLENAKWKARCKEKDDSEYGKSK